MNPVDTTSSTYVQRDGTRIYDNFVRKQTLNQWPDWRNG